MAKYLIVTKDRDFIVNGYKQVVKDAKSHNNKIFVYDSHGKLVYPAWIYDGANRLWAEEFIRTHKVGDSTKDAEEDYFRRLRSKNMDTLKALGEFCKADMLKYIVDNWDICAGARIGVDHTEAYLNYYAAGLAREEVDKEVSQPEYYTSGAASITEICDMFLAMQNYLKEMKKTMNVYVYKEFCDGDAYGEEIIEVYENKEDALKRLREQVEKYCDCSFEDIPTKFDLGDEDTVKEDYVSMYVGKGVMFWAVEEKTVASSQCH